MPVLPRDRDGITLELEGKQVALTNLRKLFWPERGITKRDLLQYYIEVSSYLLPHLRDRAMVMKRYPNGVAGPFFFMKRTPAYRPDWIRTCSITHRKGSVIDFPLVQDLPSLLWVVNLGCIDLNQWYAPCDDVNRPDVLHFDLDPTPGTGFAAVRAVAKLVRHGLESLGMSPLCKTSGSRGLHLYVPIVRGPLQKQVWGFAKQFAVTMARAYPEEITAEYRVALRPAGRVLVDYNQNAWGRTLASIYSVRPKPLATVSMPVTWDEVEAGVDTGDFRLDNAPARLRELGDLWRPLLSREGRFDLGRLT